MSLLQRDARIADCIAASFPCRVKPQMNVHTDSKIDAESIISVISTVGRYEVESADSVTEDGRAVCWFAAGPFSVFYPGDDAA